MGINALALHRAVPNKVLNPDGTYSTIQDIVKGGQGSLQDKSVEITENGVITVIPDTGYKGLSSVEITTDVASGNAICDFSKFSTSGTASNPFNYSIIHISGIVLPETVVSVSYLFANNGTNQSLTNLQSFDTFDTSHVTNFNTMCYKAPELLSVPELNTSNGTKFNQMFINCSKLVSVPVFNLEKATTMSDTYKNCSSLSDESLQNILKSLLTLTSAFTGTKTLAYIGLSSTQQTKCATFPEWTTLQANGWTAS